MSQVPQDSSVLDKPGCISVGELLFQKLRDFSKASAFPAQIDADTGESITFAELLNSSIRAALGLRARGFSIGDVLVVFSEDDLLPVVLGALFEGITVCCIEPLWKEEELRRGLQVVKPRVILSDAERLPVVVAAADSQSTHLLTTDNSWYSSVKGVSDLNAFLDSATNDVDMDAYGPQTIANLQDHVVIIDFTSGSTGLPKAVAHSNYSLLIGELSPTFWLDKCYPGMRLKVFKSLSWIIELVYSIACVAFGATRIAVDEKNVEHTLNVIQQFKVNVFTSIPCELLQLAVTVKRLSDEGRRPDLSFVRQIMCLGAPLTRSSQEAIMRDLGLPVLQTYGSTEMFCVTADTLPPTLGSTGKPLDWVKIKLVDLSTGKEITEADTPGEVRVKTPGAFTCYLGDPEATAAAFDQDGFYCTGDVAYRNAKGQLFLCDRLKNVFKFNCMQVSPVEIESILLEHSGVQEVCVGGRPHAWLGYAPTALVVRRSGCCVDPMELKNMVKERLSRPKRLRGGVIFVDNLPRTLSGKIDRIAVKDLLSQMPFELDASEPIRGPAQNANNCQAYCV